MSSRASTLRRRANRVITRVGIRAPRLIASDATAHLVETDLLRRLTGGPGNRARARAGLARLTRSGNPRAVRTALRVWGDREVPSEQLAALTTPRGRAARDGTVVLDLVRLSRRLDDPEGLRRTLARIADPRVRGVDVDGVTAEVVAEGEHALMAALGPASTRRDLSASDRAQLGAIAGVGRRRIDGEPPASIVADVPTDPLAIEAATTALPPGLGFDDLTGLGKALLAAPGARPAALHRTARALRHVGDLRLALRLAQRAQGLDPADKRIRATSTSAQESVDLLDQGWDAAIGERIDHTPRSRTVDYLLHSSLPHVSLGYSTRTHGLLTALNAGGWDVRGITRPGFPYGPPEGVDRDVPPEDVIDQVTYTRLVEGRSTYPLAPLRRHVETYARLLEPRVRERGTALLHAGSNYRNGLAAATVGRRLGIPTVYEVRGLWEYTRLAREPDFDRSDQFALLARLEADACRAADRVITITAALKDVLVDRGVAEEAIVVVPNGVNTTRFTPIPRDTALAAELGIGARTVIGYVGTVQHYEGLNLLLDAAATLQARRDDFAVLVVGDGSEVDALTDQADRLGLRDVVVFTGRVAHDEVERYYSLVDVAPFPRLPLAVCELVSPLKPFEAMAMGKAVVVSSVAAMAEIVEDGVTGLVFEKGSGPALAAALERLLDDPELLGRLADDGRRAVVGRRDWSVLADQVAEIYAELTERSATQRSAYGTGSP